MQITRPIKGFSSTNWKANFGYGALNSSIGLNVESTGMVTLNTGNNVYKGYANLFNDVLYANLKGNGGTVEINGKFVADGLLSLRATGDISFNDYFTKGTKTVVSGNGATIRKFSYNDTDVYFFATSMYSAMQRIDSYTVLEGDDKMQNGSVVSFTTDKNSYIVKIVQWGNTTNGLLVSDAYRGTYTQTDADDLIIDGFGNLTIGTTSGTYTINQNGSLYVVLSNSAFVLDVDIANKTYANSKIKLDDTLVIGKTFSASYNFTCYDSDDDTYFNGLFKAETSLQFLSDGKVRIISTSSEHDDGDDACSTDIYNPPFASKTGNVGTYSVSKNIVTVTVGEYVFTFQIDDVSVVSTLICTSTTLESTAHGYFSVKTQFSV